MREAILLAHFEKIRGSQNFYPGGHIGCVKATNNFGMTALRSADIFFSTHFGWVHPSEPDEGGIL
jgi:hypothetical protein